MKPELELSLRRAVVSLVEPPPKETKSEWCCRGNLVIPPPSSSPGPFSLAGREYAREYIDDFGNPLVTDMALCWGSQTSKTTSTMAGLAASISTEALAAIWAMPNRDLAKSFSKTRWMPLVEASPGMRGLIPRGARRHDFASLEQRLGASLLNFVWSNSPAALSSRPAPLVILDEVDKFGQANKSEADALNLVEQRTKDFSNPKRIKTSTPTLSDGLIWQEFLKGDQRRYFMPCPSCEKHVIFAWSKSFTILKMTGAEAFVVWDKESKRQDGTWDLERLRRSARAECPHCGFHIRDGHKTKMIREGVWKATNANGRASFRSRHLPSLYAASPETSFGALAVKFIEARQSLMGLQGFINGELAEPWESQENATERLELISRPDAPAMEGKGAIMLSSDFQATGAKLPWVAREFVVGGHSRLVAFGFCETFLQLRAVQLHLKIEDDLVMIDSGHEATTVYEECLRYGKFAPFVNSIPEWFGWHPCKGREATAFWKDPKSGGRRLFGVVSTPLPHNKFRLPMLEFNGPALKDVLERLRRRETLIRWELVEGIDEEMLECGATIYRSVTAEYFKHLDSEVKIASYDHRTKRVKHEWRQRSKTWPNHLRDAELQMLAEAMRRGLLTLTPAILKPEEKPKQ